MYLFLWVVNSASSLLLLLLSLLLSLSLLSLLSLDGFLDTLVILSAILLPIKSPVASAVFLFTLFQAVFITSVVDFSALSRSFWLYLLLKLYPYF